MKGERKSKSCFIDEKEAEMEQEQEMFPREMGAKIKTKVKRNEDRER